MVPTIDCPEGDRGHLPVSSPLVPTTIAIGHTSAMLEYVNLSKAGIPPGMQPTDAAGAGLPISMGKGFYFRPS